MGYDSNTYIGGIGKTIANMLKKHNLNSGFRGDDNLNIVIKNNKRTVNNCKCDSCQKMCVGQTGKYF